MSFPRPLREMQRFAADVEQAGFSGLLLTEGGRTAYLAAAAATLATHSTSPAPADSACTMPA